MSLVIQKTGKKMSKFKSRKNTSFDSVVDSLSVVNDVQAELLSVLQAKTEVYRQTKESAVDWTSRSEKAKVLKAAAQTPEGEQAMEVLSVQASSFAELYVKTSEREQEAIKEINEQLKQLANVKLQLTAVEKTQALDNTLRKMALEAKIELAETPSLNRQEIARIIHTAQALAELRNNKL
jgi:hypothetical protein